MYYYIYLLKFKGRLFVNAFDDFHMLKNDKKFTHIQQSEFDITISNPFSTERFRQAYLPF